MENKTPFIGAFFMFLNILTSAPGNLIAPPSRPISIDITCTAIIPIPEWGTEVGGSGPPDAGRPTHFNIYMIKSTV